MSSLNQAILEAQQAMGAIARDARNEFSGYDYVSAETMIGLCRDALHGAGVVLTAGDVTLSPLGDGLIVVQSFTLSCDGQERTLTRCWPAMPAKGRPLDKAVAGALTACLSYTLRDLLLIPRGDAPGVGMDDTARDRGDARSGGGEKVARSIVTHGHLDPNCPKCGGRMWNNVEKKLGEPSWRGPWFGCKNRDDCKGAIWDPPPGIDTPSPVEDEMPPPPEYDGGAR